MKTHRTCSECISSKLWDEQGYSHWCKKNGFAVNKDDCCEDFVPSTKQIKDCKNCKFNIPYCEKRATKIHHVFGFRNFCSDFVPFIEIKIGVIKGPQACIKMKREQI